VPLPGDDGCDIQLFHRAPPCRVIVHVRKDYDLNKNFITIRQGLL
jgi:hypothetical protein